jgi:uncharacterized protein
MLRSIAYKALDGFYTEREGGTTPAPGWMKGLLSTSALDQGYDIVAPGAFDKAIADRGLDGHRSIKMLWQHNPEDPIGKWLSMSQTNDGLLVEGQINLNTDIGRKAYEHLKAGEVTGLSVGYRTKRREYNEDTGVRTILEADLMEGSLVTFPMNDEARVHQVKALKIADDETISSLAKKFVETYGLSRRAADAALDALKAAMREDHELKALKAALGVAPKEAPAAPEPTAPDMKAFTPAIEALNRVLSKARER